jgi:hypothetical protein
LVGARDYAGTDAGANAALRAALSRNSWNFRYDDGPLEWIGQPSALPLEFMLWFPFVLTALALENDMPDQSDAHTESPLGASGSGTAAGESPVSAIETNLMKVAEELGTWLGTAERKTTEFMAQQNVSEHLVKIRDTAARLLAQIEKARERSR